MRHLDLLQRFPLKTNGGKIWVQKLLEEVKTLNKPNQNPKPNQLSSTVRPVSEQPSGLVTQEIDKGVLFGCESTNSRTVRPAKSCVPVSVERVNEDKDADKDEDEDQTRTERRVGGQQSTQLEEIDIDFRVPGLPHAVVK